MKMAGAKTTRGLDTSKVYYASNAEVVAAQERAAMRQLRKAEFQKKLTDPGRGAIDAPALFDPAMQRFMSMKVSHFDSHKVTRKGTWAFLWGAVIPIVTIYKYLNYEQERRERVFRSGSIPYAERLWKYD
ncbi:uncharacterized protein [Watersipora subatra]|uniref:uncharacterized protein n=1 Tax=Watersipora subatra TaxID=2589382 RepID=UPI00355B44FC